MMTDALASISPISNQYNSQEWVKKSMHALCGTHIQEKQFELTGIRSTDVSAV